MCMSVVFAVVGYLCLCCSVPIRLCGKRGENVVSAVRCVCWCQLSIDWLSICAVEGLILMFAVRVSCSYSVFADLDCVLRMLFLQLAVFAV